MIIALKKQLQIRDTNLNVINVNHWIVTDIVHRVDKELVVISIHGYTNRQSRIDNESPVVKNVRFRIKNTYDENDVILTRDYNKFINHQSDKTKHKDYIRETALNFLRKQSDFIDSTDD